MHHDLAFAAAMGVSSLALQRELGKTKFDCEHFVLRHCFEHPQDSGEDRRCGRQALHVWDKYKSRHWVAQFGLADRYSVLVRGLSAT